MLYQDADTQPRIRDVYLGLSSPLQVCLLRRTISGLPDNQASHAVIAQVLGR